MSYRLFSYSSDGAARAGVAVGTQMFDAAAFADEPLYADMLGVLANWGTADRRLAALSEKAMGSQVAAQPLGTVQLLAPVLYPGNIFCAGANYKDHVAEMARSMKQPVGPNAKELGELPWHFIKVSRSAVVGTNAVARLPSYCTDIDWEIELAAVIGTPAKDVPIERALDYVAGYTIANDLSARDIGRKHTSLGSPFYYDWITMKNFDDSCPLGPWIVPASQIPDPQSLALKLWLNGELMQNSHTSQMIFSVAEQISMLSSRLTLQPGDIVLTGTPAGVGLPRGIFLKSGDLLRLWIENIGELNHSVV